MNPNKKHIAQDILNKINSSFSYTFPLEKEGGAFKNLKDTIKTRWGLYSPLLWMLEYQQDIKLIDSEIDYLIENSDLSIEYNLGETALTQAIKYGRSSGLTPKQYQKLIEGCPQSNSDEKKACDLHFALSINNIVKFSDQNWISLVKKTDKKFFSYDYLGLAANTIVKLSDIIKASNLGDIILEKIDFNEKTKVNMIKNILYAALVTGTFDFSLETARKIDINVLINYWRELEAGIITREVPNKLKTIISIIKIENEIKESIPSGASGMANKI